MSGTPVTDVVKALFKEVDEKVPPMIAGHNVTCRSGCSHCCMMLTSISLPEGLAIAEHLLTGEEWKELLPKLRETSLAHCYEGIDRRNYFLKRIPCAFLKDNKCSIYELRPACCRLHYVISPPEHCSPDNTTEKTKILGLTSVEKTFWELGADVAQQVLGTKLFMGPIPMMVLYCMELISRDDPSHHIIKEACEGVPSPGWWLKKNIATLAGAEK